MSVSSQLIRHKIILTFVASLLFIFAFHLAGGLGTLYFDTDMGRDLYELSNLWIGKSIIWLGPRLSAGIHASPVYYYLFYPALYLGRGNPNSLVILNLFIVSVLLCTFGYLATKKWGTRGILGMISIGLLPWFIIISKHFGNGYTYAYILMLGLSLLYFNFPIWLSGLLVGLSISFHPASFFAIPLLIYECIRRKEKLSAYIVLVLVLVLPWVPIITFEIITKGYISRHWLTNPAVGLNISPNLSNLSTMGSFMGIHYLLLIISVLFIFLFSNKRLRVWLTLSGLGIIFFTILHTSQSHYFLGLTSILSFILITAILELSDKNRTITVLLAIFIAINLLNYRVPQTATRNINTISTLVDKIDSAQLIPKESKLAIVAILDKETKVPQADDYRALLRFKGYTVLDPDLYNQADLLIIFVEQKDFDWKKWSSWEIDRFGTKKFNSELSVDGIRLVIYTR